jgi:hypothetical protein
MGSVDRRLGTAEMVLLKILIVEALVRAEIQDMLTVLDTSEAIESSLYEKVLRIVTRAGYIEGGEDGA